MLPDTLSKSYKKVLKANNIKLTRFHSLRHTYGTRLFERGVPQKGSETIRTFFYKDNC